jgi:bifunctional ADP-heptose synthase (sugar kinase/adenylyltransferase)
VGAPGTDAGQLALTPRLPGLLALIAPEMVVAGASAVRDRHSPGRAAGVAACLAGFGAGTALSSFCGSDLGGVLVRRRLAECGVDTSGLVIEAGCRTPVDDASPWVRGSTAHAVASVLAVRGGRPDGVVVVDDGSPAVSDAIRRRVIACRRRLRTVVVGATDARAWAPVRPDLVVLPAMAAARALGLPRPDGGRIEDLAGNLAAVTGARAQLVTLEGGGSLLLRGRQRPYRTWPARPGRCHVRAAAESFLAVLALGVTAELPLTTSLELAQAAADLAEVSPDPGGCGPAALAARLAGHRSAVLRPPPEIIRTVHRHRCAGRRVVVTSGSFDLLRGNEIQELNHARRMGDVLVVAVHSDAAVRRAGRHWPLCPAAERAAAVAALSCVDHVTITDHAARLLDRLRVHS